MNYQVILRPVSGPVQGDTVVDENGAAAITSLLGVITEAQVEDITAFVNAQTAQTNASLVAIAAAAATVQPSADQVTGLLGYITAVENGKTTTSIETAIGDVNQS
jgi:hypothetical protein